MDTSPVRRSIIEITSPFKDEHVSPPTRTTSCSLARLSMPSMKAVRKGTEQDGGMARERRKYKGRPPIDAMSERFTARDFLPRLKGLVKERSKWTPSISISLVESTSLSALQRRAAASSPMPIGTFGVAGTLPAIRPISPNSPTSSRCGADFFISIQISEIIFIRVGLGVIKHKQSQSVFSSSCRIMSDSNILRERQICYGTYSSFFLQVLLGAMLGRYICFSRRCQMSHVSLQLHCSMRVEKNELSMK